MAFAGLRKNDERGVGLHRVTQPPSATCAKNREDKSVAVVPWASSSLLCERFVFWPPTKSIQTTAPPSLTGSVAVAAVVTAGPSLEETGLGSKEAA